MIATHNCRRGCCHGVGVDVGVVVEVVIVIVIVIDVVGMGQLQGVGDCMDNVTSAAWTCHVIQQMLQRNNIQAFRETAVAVAAAVTIADVIDFDARIVQSRYFEIRPLTSVQLQEIHQ